MKILNEYLKVEGIEEFRLFIKNTGRVKYFKKDEFVFEQGNICKFVGYIESGGFRYLSYTSAGKEQIVGYSFEKDFVADYGSFINSSPAIANAQAIKDSIVWMVNQDELISYYDSCDYINFRSKLIETFFEDIYKRLISLYCDTPEERYLKLITKYPPILNEVSLKEIASFIKITPETLSRIRKNLTQEKNS